MLLPQAHVPIERTDPNSRLAHQQLVQKARTGRTDVYFLGDSITRRWGATDPMYREFLAHWRESFFGWNASNFGWGGDTTSNILWRIENGELDGVHPKVIVLLAGTNNVGAGAKAEDVAKGIESIVQVCRRKAPHAKIVLNAVFPRNDSPAFGPTIREINERIAKFADGEQVRFLNLSPKLADENGKLLEGVAVDGLHLSLKGYRIWGDALRPILRELLGPPAKVDLAPPPTGDPSVRGTS